MLPRMGTVFHEITEKYNDFRASKNNDKTGYKQHAEIIVKTDCFDAAGLEVVDINVKHVCFDQFVKFPSSLCNRMTVQVQTQRKTLCF